MFVQVLFGLDLGARRCIQDPSDLSLVMLLAKVMYFYRLLWIWLVHTFLDVPCLKFIINEENGHAFAFSTPVTGNDPVD